MKRYPLLLLLLIAVASVSASKIYLVNNIYPNGTNIYGMPGTNGTNGINGTNGVNGQNGINGTDGISITIISAISLSNGSLQLNFSDGTNLTSINLSGARGATGASGADGAPGTNGTNGINGVSGTNGTNGVSGTNGTNGVNGVSGTNGTNGINGVSGTNGTNGVNGVSGTNGTNGVNGVNGQNGSNATLVAAHTFINFTVSGNVYTIGANLSAFAAQYLGIAAAAADALLFGGKDTRYYLNGSTTIGDGNHSLNIARTGNCSAGTVMQNVSSTGVSCVTPTGGSGAPTTPRYIIVGANDATLTNEVNVPEDFFKYVTFDGDAVDATPAILGTETVSVIEPGRYGVHNFATAASIGADAGYSLGATTATNTLLYNASLLQFFGASLYPLQNTTITVAIGWFGTSTTQNLTTVNNGIMFWINDTGSGAQNWSAKTCRAGTCTTNVTRARYIANFTKFEITKSGDGYLFRINDTDVSNLSTNIPFAYNTSWIGAWAQTQTAGAVNMKIDYIVVTADRIGP